MQIRPGAHRLQSLVVATGAQTARPARTVPNDDALLHAPARPTVRADVRDGLIVEAVVRTDGRYDGEPLQGHARRIQRLHFRFDFVVPARRRYRLATPRHIPFGIEGKNGAALARSLTCASLISLVHSVRSALLGTVTVGNHCTFHQCFTERLDNCLMLGERNTVTVTGAK